MCLTVFPAKGLRNPHWGAEGGVELGPIRAAQRLYKEGNGQAEGIVSKRLAMQGLRLDSQP